MTDQELQELIERVNDWDDVETVGFPGREETFYWMRQARELAVIVQKMRKPL